MITVIYLFIFISWVSISYSICNLKANCVIILPSIIWWLPLGIPTVRIQIPWDKTNEDDFLHVRDLISTWVVC